MDVSDYNKAKGSFLKADVVKKDTKIGFLIKEEGEMVKSEKFGNEKLHIPGEYADEEKVFDCSKTNSRTIAKALGEDTSKWIGHTIYFEVYRTKTSDGKMTDALNVSDVK